MSAKPSTVVATAGHVDHGKSTLVRALTGVDPDRWPEERARGLTIDLGYAHATLPSGAVVSFVDVPGHVRFIKNMLAGAGSVKACLFVVAATEGWKEQTEEHLRLLSMLGTERGLVAVSKVDAAGEDLAREVLTQVRRRSVGTFLEGSPAVSVDAPKGRGLHELVAALDELVSSAPAADDNGRPRLWVDRSFSAKGAGTVVTGTLAGGRLCVGSIVELARGPGPECAPVRARVRALQIHGGAHEEAAPGQRVAANLAWTGPIGAPARGQALVQPGHWEMTRVVDATLSVLATHPCPVGRRGNYQVHFGTAHQPVSLRPLGRSDIAPGTTGAVRLHLPLSFPLVMGDRFVLRDGGRGTTVGGGEILDVSPVMPAKKARPDHSVSRIVDERGWVDAALLERLTGQRCQPTIGRWVVSPALLDAQRRDLRSRLTAAGAFGVEASVLPEKDRCLLATMDDVRLRRGRYVLDGTGDIGSDPFVIALGQSLFDPPSPKDMAVTQDTLREIATRGLAVNCNGLWLHTDALGKARAALLNLAQQHPGGFTVSQFRQSLSTSRRVAMALLEYFDASGECRRIGDLRVAGAALARELERKTK